MTYTLAQQYEDGKRNYPFLITYVGALRAERAALKAENASLLEQNANDGLDLMEEVGKRKLAETENERLKCCGSPAMSDLLPPFHEVMCSIAECDRANDRVAVLEAELAETQSNLSFIIDYTTSERERKALRRIAELEAENKLLDEARENANAAAFRAKAELEKARWATTQWQTEEDDWVRDREMWAETTRLLRLRLEKAEAKRDDWHHACDVAAENGVTIRRSLEKAEAEVTRLGDLFDRACAAGHS